MVADDLRRQADHFLDLDILADYIARDSVADIDDYEDEEEDDYEAA